MFNVLSKQRLIEMGSVESLPKTELQINLDRPDKFYFTGDILSGTIDLDVSLGKLGVTELFLILTGGIGYSVGDTAVRYNNQGSHFIGQTKLLFYSTKVIIAQPQSGQNEIPLAPGQYSWRFEILLPVHLPPTINLPTSSPHIYYNLQVTVSTPWFEISIDKKNLSFQVCPRVNILQNPQCSVPIVFGNRNRKGVVFRGTLDKGAYVPGESIILTVEIENPQKALIQSIKLFMMQFYQIAQNRHENTLHQLVLQTIRNRKDEYMTEILSLIIPPGPLLPTYGFQRDSDRNTHVSIQYYLRLELTVHGILSDFNAQTPFTIGTEPRGQFNQQPTSDHEYRTERVSNNDDDDDPPPDYYSAIQK